MCFFGWRFWRVVLADYWLGILILIFWNLIWFQLLIRFHTRAAFWAARGVGAMKLNVIICLSSGRALGFIYDAVSEIFLVLILILLLCITVLLSSSLKWKLFSIFPVVQNCESIVFLPCCDMPVFLCLFRMFTRLFLIRHRTRSTVVAAVVWDWMQVHICEWMCLNECIFQNSRLMVVKYWNRQKERVWSCEY